MSCHGFPNISGEVEDELAFRRLERRRIPIKDNGHVHERLGSQKELRLHNIFRNFRENGQKSQNFGVFVRPIEQSYPNNSLTIGDQYF
jgi:hypothetical protein